MSIRHAPPACPLAFSLAVFLAALQSACAGVVPLRHLGAGPTGGTFKPKEVDLTLLEAADVSREDVAARLAPIDTGCGGTSLFWARWVESGWGYFWFVGAQSGVAGGGGRLWHVKNLLATFDEAGVLRGHERIDDDKVLWRRIRARIALESPAETSRPVVVSGPFGVWWNRQVSNQLRLDSGGIVIVLKDRDVAVAPSQFVRFSHEWSAPGKAGAAVTCHRIHFSVRTPIGRSARICVPDCQLLEVYRYLNAVAPVTMKWE
jgi:hypothetical protein